MTTKPSSTFLQIQDVSSTPIFEADFTRGIPSGWNYSRAGSATYFGSDGLISTATTNTPRYERKWDSKKKMGLLLEPESTNKFLWSQKFDDASWIKDNSSVSQVGTYGTSPLSENWWEFNEGSATGEHDLRQSLTLEPGKHTLQILVRDGGDMQTFVLSFGSLMQVAFDTTVHKYVGHFQGEASVLTLFTYDVRQVGTNTWVYSATVGNNTGASVVRDVGLMASQTGGASVNFTGTNRKLIFAYMQAEKKPQPTSYIPTTTTTTTRPRDILYYDKINQVPGFSPLVGTMAVDVTPLTGTAEYMVYADLNAQDAAYAYINILQSGYRFKSEYWDNNAQVDLLSASDSRLQYDIPTTVVAAWADQNFAFAEGGQYFSNDLGGIIPTWISQVSRLNIGRRYSVSDPDALGARFCIQRVRIWEDRLPDSDIVTLSLGQAQNIRIDQLQRLGVGAGASSLDTTRVIDVDPGDTSGNNASLTNIRSIVRASNPTTSNLFPVGLIVSSGNINPTSGVTTRYIGAAAVNGQSLRNNSADTSTNTNNLLQGGVFSAVLGVNLPALSYSGANTAIQGTASTSSGLIGASTAVNAICAANGTATGPKSGAMNEATGVNSIVRSLSGTTFGGTISTGYGVRVQSTVGTTGIGSTIGTLYGLFVDSQPTSSLTKASTTTLAFPTSTTITRSDAGSFIADGFAANDWISVYGSANTANNRRHQITAITATEITCAASTFTVTTSASGVYIAKGYGVVVDKWAIYQAGSSDKNYFAGKVQVGSTTDDASGAKIQVSGSVSISGTTEGIFMQSPNGTKWKITVGNDGSLTTTAV